MFTKLAKRAGRLFLMLNNATQKKYGFEAKNTSGVTKYVKAVNSNYGYIGGSFSLSNSVDGFHVGKGTTLPTENDYALEDPITSGLTANTATVIWANTENEPDDCTYAITLRNSSEGDITISEIGYYAQFGCTSSQGNTGGYGTAVFMIDRTLLDTPVTIAPGETVTINCKISVSEL